MFYPYSIKINRCKGSCNTINDPYAKICVPNQIKNINVNYLIYCQELMKKRHIKWHKTCKCKCKLNGSICNNKQRWNDDRCICESKENYLTKECVIKDLFAILVIVSVNVINHVILENI